MPQESIKQQEEYRNYKDSQRQDVVSNTYRLNHTLQTYDYVLDMKKKHLNFDKAYMSIWDAITKLDSFVDSSDPDADFPQIFHCLQTAEALRSAWPEHDWLHLSGLIHDLGKLMSLPDFGNLPQWSVVGDTFPVGCKFSDKICFPEFFEDNPDSSNPKFNTMLGVYKEGCGIDNLHISWSHDEYLYQVLVHNNCKIPKEGLLIIRYHSFYAWHQGGAYRHLMNESDYGILEWVRRFQKADLYSKTTNLPDPVALKPYYENLIAKYLPKQILEW
jgi:inositol oxygenase